MFLVAKKIIVPSFLLQVVGGKNINDKHNYEQVIRQTKNKLKIIKKDILENGRNVNQDLDLIKTLISNNSSSQIPKDSLLAYIEELEHHLDDNLKSYQRLHQQQQNKITEIRKIADLEKSFAEKYRKTIIVFVGIILILLCSSLIIVWIARKFRNQRNQLSVQNTQIAQHNEEIKTQRDNLGILSQNLESEKQKSESLLLNILPLEVANELKLNQYYKARTYKLASVVFSDFVGFTSLAQKMNSEELIKELDDCFTGFDDIIVANNLEKIKTIGDAYMCVGGVPSANQTNPVDAVLAALKMRMFIEKKRKERILEDGEYWQCRFGISTGEIIAGVIGKSKFAYDVWGDTVNTASRLESSSIAGEINISEKTYQYVKDFFECKHRGEIEVKGKGKIAMYFIKAIKPELSIDSKGFQPNELFIKKKEEMFS